MTEENKKVENTEEVKAEQPKAEQPKAEEAKTEQPKTEAKAEQPKAEEKAAAKTEAGSQPIAERAPTQQPKREKREPRGEKGKDGKKGGHGKKRGRDRDNQEQSEFTEKVVQVRRVTKVVKGGKKLSFRITVIIGNEKGKVGVGVGKAAEVLTGIKKAVADARKKLVDIETVSGTNTISHNVNGIAGGSKVLLRPAAEGTGIIAGGTARIVLELAGVGDVLAKSQGSKSPLNVARATVDALSQLRKFEDVASLRGISVKKMLFA